MLHNVNTSANVLCALSILISEGSISRMNNVLSEERNSAFGLRVSLHCRVAVPFVPCFSLFRALIAKCGMSANWLDHTPA